MSKRCRAWCFTLNNPGEDDLKEIQARTHGLNRTYIVVGREVGEQGTPHLQGYVEFKSVKSLTQVRAINPRIHWEARRGTAPEAAAYCKKEGNVALELGECSQQGKRSDLQEIAEQIVSQKRPLVEVAEAAPSQWVRYHRGFTALYNTVHMKPRTEMPTIWWVYGESGSGKTRFCTDQHKDSHYMKDNSMWWDGYNQEEAIIIDDFELKEWIPGFKYLLRLLDRYRFQGQVKGGYVQINSPFIYITAIEAPDTIFGRHKEWPQIKRRLTGVIGMEACEVASKVFYRDEHPTSSDDDEKKQDVQ